MATAPTPAAADDAVAPKKKSKLLLISAVTLVTLGAGGGGTWYFMRPADPNAVHAAPPAKPAIFLPLESFTVNLVPQEGQPQYLQAGLTLKLADHVKVDVIKERMPEIRDRVLMVLSAKKATDVLPTTGKQKLAAEIVAAVEKVIGPAALARPAAKAPAQAAPAAGEAAAATLPEGEKAAEGEHPAEGAAHTKAPAPKAVAAAPAVEVLFTSFIIQ